MVDKAGNQIFLDIQSDNKEKFESLFFDYYEHLCAYAFRILKNKENAEEITQEVFIRLWENRKELHVTSSIKAYLYKAVHNKCINFLEHRKIELNFSSRFVKDNANLISPLSKDYPIANLLSKEIEDSINKAIASLPDQCREVFIKVRYEEMSYSEVAELLGISVNTVKTHLQRAVSKLRELLKEFLP